MSATPTLGFLAATRLVAEREVGVKLRDRAFLVSTALTLLLIAVAFALPSLVDRPDTHRVAVSGETAEALVTTLAEEADADEAGFGVEVVIAAGPDEAEDLVALEEADAAVLDRVPGDSDPAPVEVVALREVPGDVRAGLDAAVTAQARAAALAGLGADAATTDLVLTGVTAPERVLDPDAPDPGTSLLLEFAFAAAFFFAAFTYGFTLAQSVTEEKQQRVVEILVAAVPVRALLTGKILGNVALALGQIVMLLAVGFLAAAATGAGDLVTLLSGSAGWFVLFFVAGFIMLATLWAVAGSLASRVEDLGATSLPVQMIVLLPFVLAVSVREGEARTIMSYVPFTSTIVMPQRVVAGEAEWWQALVALALVIGTAVAFVLVAERLYRGSLLRTRGRVALREAWSTPSA